MIPSILHHETWQQALCQFLEEEVLTPDCAEFDKDWKLQGKLGKGGFATVYKIRRRGCLYALKILNQAEDCDSDPSYLKEKKFMFEEGLALKTAAHKNMVGFNAIVLVPSGTRAFKNRSHIWGMLLECCEGGSVVRKVLDIADPHKKPYTSLDAVEWCINIGEVLNCMHTLEPMLIHRDIKLENILLTSGRTAAPVQAKLCDLGLFKVLDGKKGFGRPSQRTGNYSRPTSVFDDRSVRSGTASFSSQLGALGGGGRAGNPWKGPGSTNSVGLTGSGRPINPWSGPGSTNSVGYGGGGRPLNPWSGPGSTNSVSLAGSARPLNPCVDPGLTNSVGCGGEVPLTLGPTKSIGMELAALERSRVNQDAESVSLKGEWGTGGSLGVMPMAPAPKKEVSKFRMAIGQTDQGAVGAHQQEGGSTSAADQAKVSRKSGESALSGPTVDGANVSQKSGESVVPRQSGDESNVSQKSGESVVPRQSGDESNESQKSGESVVSRQTGDESNESQRSGESAVSRHVVNQPHVRRKFGESQVPRQKSRLAMVQLSVSVPFLRSPTTSLDTEEESGSDNSGSPPTTSQSSPANVDLSDLPPNPALQSKAGGAGKVQQPSAWTSTADVDLSKIPPNPALQSKAGGAGKVQQSSAWTSLANVDLSKIPPNPALQSKAGGAGKVQQSSAWTSTTDVDLSKIPPNPALQSKAGGAGKVQQPSAWTSLANVDLSKIPPNPALQSKAGGAGKVQQLSAWTSLAHVDLSKIPPNPALQSKAGGVGKVQQSSALSFQEGSSARSKARSGSQTTDFQGTHSSRGSPGREHMLDNRGSFSCKGKFSSQGEARSLGSQDPTATEQAAEDCEVVVASERGEESEDDLSPDEEFFDITFNLTGNTGSFFYMAPEVHLRQPYNQKADVFSFGCVMYELFSRSLLVVTHCKNSADAPKEARRYVERVAQRWRPPCVDVIPEKVWDLIEACWHFDPGARPDMYAVVDELREVQDILLSTAAGDNTSSPVASVVNKGDSAMKDKRPIDQPAQPSGCCCVIS